MHKESRYVSLANKTSKRLKRKRYLNISKREVQSYRINKTLMNSYGLATVRQLGHYTLLKYKYRTCMRSYTKESPVYGEVLEKLKNYGIIEEKNYRIGQIKEEAFLKRRFQTLLAKKYNLKIYHARQLITQGFAYFKNKRRKICSFLVAIKNQKDIELRNHPLATKDA